MTGRYLTDLADVCRRAGLNVREVSGWQTRARSSGGFGTGQPCAIVVHHTASPASWDGQRDADFIAHNSSIAPIAQLYLDRRGTVWVIAAGACNNAGSGGPIGPLPKDGANTRTIGIEAGNAGTGEVWPDVQQAVYRRLVRALCDHYMISVNHVYAHFEYAVGRKIDPAGQSDYATGANKWDMAKFRADVSRMTSRPIEGPMTQGELYDVLTLWYSINFGPLIGTVEPSVSQGKVIATQTDVYDVLTLWHAVNPGITNALKS